MKPVPTALPAPLQPLAPFFAAKGWRPFDFQIDTWNAYLAGQSGLLHAPTGLGKTLAVWLGPLADAIAHPPNGCTVLWLTPLRALAADTLMALREPIDILSLPWKVEARTGDTSAYRRAKLRERLPFALVTTPESLSLMLTYDDFREKIAGLRAVVVDEWHELLGTKRGVQTELCLARLRRWLPDLRVWGLSATLGNLEEAASVLLGPGRPGTTVSAARPKKIHIHTLIPRQIENFPWSGHLGTKLVKQVVSAIAKAGTTLLFTNTRSQTEIWFQELLAARPAWAGELAMHHGSLDRDERREVEQRLREGSVRCVVCTSSLDLGVDFSPVEQVIQVGSPKGVARLLQRAGRSGHQPGKPSRIIGVPTNALELIEFAAVRDAAARREIESRTPLRKPLDVLVQHLVTCAIGEPTTPTEMLAEVRASHAYQDLTEAEWQWAVGFISSGGKALAAYPHYQKAREIEGGRLAVTEKRHIQLHRMGIGTISADAAISIRFASGRTLGTVEEGFISRIRPGGQFVFSGRRLELVRIHQQVATVRPGRATHRGQIAIWGGAKMPLSSELAHAVARRLRGDGPASAEMDAVAPILAIQKSWSALPDDQSLLVEHTRTREGEHLFIFPFAGRLAHEGIGALAAFRLSRLNGQAIQVTMNDYGFGLTAPRGLHLDAQQLRAALDPADLLDDLLACMNTAELSRRQFREIARIAGLVLQAAPGPRKRTRDLQISASLLFEVFTRYDPNNLLLDQARREILERQLDFTRLQSTLLALRERPLRLIETAHLTPMAFPLWADRLQAFLATGTDTTSRLEAMLLDLESAASSKSLPSGS